MAALATAAVAIGGCGSSDSESSGGASGGGDKPEVTDITIGINADGATGAPLLVGIEKGYFRDEGLNVKTQIVAGGAATVPLLISESLQAGYVSSIAWFQAHLNNIDFEFVGNGCQLTKGGTELVVLPDSPIRSLEDLANKKISVPTLNGMDLWIKARAEGEGVDPSSYKFVEATFPQVAPQLQRGNFDVGSVTEPFLTLAREQLNVRTIADIFDGATASLPNNFFLVNEKFASENPNTTAALKRAFAKASADAKADPQIVRDLLPGFTKMDPKLAEKITLPSYDPEIDVPALQRAADILAKYGGIEKQFDVKELLPSAG